MKFNFMFFLFLLLTFPTISMAAEMRTIEVEFTFTAPDDPAKQLLGYRLYKEAEQVCETNDPSASRVTCELLTEEGTFDFNLTAHYADNTESPQSPSFPFTIDSPPPPPLQAIIATQQTAGQIPFNVSFAGTDSTGDIATYSWDFGDGTSNTGPNTSHTYAVSGTYTAVLHVVDQAGATHQATTTITAQPNTSSPKPPTGVLSVSSTSGDAPLVVNFNGSSSTTPYSPIVSYNWAFGDGSQATGETTSHTFTTAGTYNTQLTVTDSQGLSHTVSTSIVVNATTPPDSGAKIRNLEVEFSFTDPNNPSKQLIGYKLYKEGQEVCVTNNPGTTRINCDLLTEDGTFYFNLTALYADNTESPQSPSFPFTIDSDTPVGPAPLQAVISTPQAAGEIPFNVSFSATDSTGDIVTYSWDFGDGTNNTGPNSSHTYSVSGTYTAILSVVDQDGAVNQATKTITAQPNTSSPEPPTAVISSSSAIGDAPLVVSFDGSSSTTPYSPIVSYSWNFGDGSEATGKTTSHSFTAAGTYHTQLTVADSQGLSDTVSTPIVVIEIVPNEQPTAVITADAPSTDAPLTFSFNGSQSFDPDGSITQYSWNFGDGTTGSGQTALHTYTSEGSYTVSLEVTDNAGETSIASTEIVCDINTIPIEVGELSIDNNWVTVTFETTFSQPVVIAGPPASTDAEPVLVRIRNINETSFEIRLQEWDYQDGTHTAETISYMVIEQGIYTLDNGSKIEAASFTGSSSYTSVSLQQTYDFTPVILTQVVTENEIDAVTGRINNINQYSFDFKLQEMETTKTAHIPETIGYIAWEPGKGEVSGLLYEAGMTAKSVKHRWYDLSFETEFPELPFFIAEMQTCAGGDTATVRSQNMTMTAIEVKIEEEQSRDSEVNHTKEVVGYFTIGATAE